MQTAIDRVFRTFLIKPPAWRADESKTSERQLMRQQAEAVAGDLLENFKTHLAGNSGRPH